MNIYDLQETVKQPQTLAALAGLINPATIVPALSVGVIGVTAVIAIKAVKSLKDENKKLLSDKHALEDELEYLEAEYEEIEEDDEPLEQPLLSASEPLNSTVETNGTDNGSNTVKDMDDEALKKEMIRQTMSELGKRSAAVRARKKVT